MKKTKAEIPVNNKSNQKEAQLQQSLKRMKIIAAILGGVVVIAIAGFVFMNMNSSKSDTTETEQTALERFSENNSAAAPGQELQISGNPVPGQASQGSGGNTVPAGTTAPGMNPPHGQPGHRCEIPVGSPLDGSKPATSGSGSSTSNTTTTKTPVTTNTTTSVPSAPAGSTPPGMNPPHGQPGHRCDIPVGSPLK